MKEVKKIKKDIEITPLKKIHHLLNYATSLGGRASITMTRFLRFGTSSSFTLMIDMLILFILVEFFGILAFIGAGISFTISTSINYFINRSWGFKGTLTGVIKGYSLFLFFSILGIALTVFLMWIFVDVLEVHYLISRIIVAIIEGTLTFIVNSIFTFKMPETLNIREGYFKEHKEV